MSPMQRCLARKSFSVVTVFFLNECDLEDDTACLYQKIESSVKGKVETENSRIPWTRVRVSLKHAAEPLTWLQHMTRWPDQMTR